LIEKIDTQSVIATLRSDAPWPILHLWDALIDRDIVAEYPEYTQRITLNAYMQGEMGASRSSITLDVEDLVGLITSLRELRSWQASDRALDATGRRWKCYWRMAQGRTFETAVDGLHSCRLVSGETRRLSNCF
jgi:hypothetical protein